MRVKLSRVLLELNVEPTQARLGQSADLLHRGNRGGVPRRVHRDGANLLMTAELAVFGIISTLVAASLVVLAIDRRCWLADWLGLPHHWHLWLHGLNVP